MKPPKLALALTIIGLLLIALSVLWTRIIFPLEDVNALIDHDRLEQLDQAMRKNSEVREKFGETSAVENPESRPADLAEQQRAAQRSHEENQAYIDRWNFLRGTLPQIIRLVGVICAAIGSVLYPILILRRKREAAVSIFE